jgi:thymidine phosphorylase
LVRPGILFLVVGPSGAGKDTLLDGASRALAGDPRFVFTRRIITRPEDAGGEAHEQASPEAFAAREAGGGFFVTWSAHGLRYGLAAAIEAELAAGCCVIANVSRTVPARVAGRVRAVVVEITAPAEFLALRLAARAREDEADIASRLSREGAAYPDGMTVRSIVNDSTPEIGIARLVAALDDLAGEAAGGA